MSKVTDKVGINQDEPKEEWINNIGINLKAKTTFNYEDLLSLKYACTNSPIFVQDEKLIIKLLSTKTVRRKYYNLYAEVLTQILLAYDKVRDLPKFVEMISKILIEFGETLGIKTLPVDHLQYTGNYIIPYRFMASLINSIGQMGSHQIFGVWSSVKKILISCIPILNNSDISEEMKSSIALVIYICASCLGSSSIHSISNVSGVPQKLYRFLQELAIECILPIVNEVINLPSNCHLSTALLQLFYIWGEIRIILLTHFPECDEAIDKMDSADVGEIFDFSLLMPFIDKDIWRNLWSHINCSENSFQNCLNQLVVQKLSLVTVFKKKYQLLLAENNFVSKKRKISHTEGIIVNPRIRKLSQMEESCIKYLINCLKNGSVENIDFLSLLMTSIIPTLHNNELNQLSRVVVNSFLMKSSSWINFVSSSCFQEYKSLHLKVFEEVCANLKSAFKKNVYKKRFSQICDAMSLENVTFEIMQNSVSLKLFSKLEETHLLGILDILSYIPLSPSEWSLSLKIFHMCLCIAENEIEGNRNKVAVNALNLIIKIFVNVRNATFFSIVDPLSLLKHLVQTKYADFKGDEELINYALCNNVAHIKTDIESTIIVLFQVSIKALLRQMNNTNRVGNLIEYLLELRNVEEKREMFLLFGLILFSELQTEPEIYRKDMDNIHILVSSIHSMRKKNNGLLIDITCVTAYILIVINNNDDIKDGINCEEIILIKDFISEGKVIALRQTKNSHLRLRQISNTFLALALSWESRFWQDAKIQKTFINLDEVIWDLDQSMALKIIDSLPQEYFEQIAKRNYHTIQDSKHCDKLYSALDSWNKLVKLKLTGNKRDLTKNFTENILGSLLIKLQGKEFNSDLCVISLELQMTHSKINSPVVSQIESLVINYIVEFDFEGFKLTEFIKVFNASTQCLMHYVRSKKNIMKNCLVATIHTIIYLAKGLLYQSSQTNQLSRGDLKKLEVCCQNFDLIVNELCHANEAFLELAHYLVEGLVNNLQKSAVYSDIKRWMERSIIQLFKMTPMPKLQYLLTILPSSQVTLLKYLMTTYSENYRFNIFL